MPDLLILALVLLLVANLVQAVERRRYARHSEEIRALYMAQRDLLLDRGGSRSHCVMLYESFKADLWPTLVFPEQTVDLLSARKPNPLPVPVEE